MSKKPLAIFGAGGLGRELGSWIGKLGIYDFIGFFDDNPDAKHMDVSLVLGDLSALKRYSGKELYLVIGIGDPLSKAKIAGSLEHLPFLKFPSIIHPNAVVDDMHTIAIGAGSVITAGCILTTRITLGKHVLLNLNSTVGHDTEIRDHSSVMPGVNISGSVTVGKNVLIGSGASVLNSVTIGDHTKIGAGAVVLKDLPADCTAVGVPAKIIRS